MILNENLNTKIVVAVAVYINKVSHQKSEWEYLNELICVLFSFLSCVRARIKDKSNES